MKPAMTVFTLTGLLIGGSAFAVDPPVNARLAAANRLVDMVGIQATVRASEEGMVSSMIAGNPMLGPYRDVILNWAGQYLSWEALRPQLVQMYAKTFTKAELADLIRFYASPAGRKLVEVSPQLTRQSMAIGQGLARDHIPELQQMIKARAEQLSKLPVAPPPQEPASPTGKPR
ncbi:MAG: DUF2059 domain-containing protein [Gammaproteobacteria bacterium]|nr:DUF2059 domain-containing protein [Gammaproteobacteria bacterium]